MKFSVLNSSSSGNSVYLEINDKKILIDAGITYKSLIKKMSNLNIFIDKLDYIFISHEHIDHVSGLKSLCSKLKPLVYLTKETFNSIEPKIKDSISPIYLNFIDNNQIIDFDGFNVKTFSVSHDASDPIGFIFEDKNKSLVYLTDTGEFNNYNIVKNKDAYILESNHEPKMLELSNRPWSLINRIMSNKGHMSNEASAELFDIIKGDKTKLLVLYHLSSECNTKELAYLAFKNKIDETKIKLVISDKKEETELLEI